MLFACYMKIRYNLFSKHFFIRWMRIVIKSQFFYLICWDLYLRGLVSFFRFLVYCCFYFLENVGAGGGGYMHVFVSMFINSIILLINLTLISKIKILIFNFFVVHFLECLFLTVAVFRMFRKLVYLFLCIYVYF